MTIEDGSLWRNRKTGRPAKVINGNRTTSEVVFGTLFTSTPTTIRYAYTDLDTRVMPCSVTVEKFHVAFTPRRK